MTLIQQLLRLRLNFRRKTQVIYRAPGFLHGTYMLEKRGVVSHADLVNHAIDMRYGDGVCVLQQPMNVNSIVIEIVEILH